MINEKVTQALEHTGAKLIRQEEFNGHLLHWYSRADDMVLIQEYPDDHGFEVFLSVPGVKLDATVNEIYGNKQLEMQWFVRTTGPGFGGNWGKGDQLKEALENAHVGLEANVHVSVVSEDWELDNAFGTLTCKYGKHSEPFQLSDFLNWDTVMRMASDLCEANGLESYAIDKLAGQLHDRDAYGEGVKVPWHTEEKSE